MMFDLDETRKQAFLLAVALVMVPASLVFAMVVQVWVESVVFATVLLAINILWFVATLTSIFVASDPEKLNQLLLNSTS